MSASFNDLLSDIYGLTKRPDLVSDTKLALKGATLKVHNKDFYTRDYYELGLKFTTAEYYQQWDYKTNIPLFRQIDYIRKSDVNAAQGAFLELLAPTSTIDRYNVNKEDIAYMAGANINIRSSDLLQYILVGCWVNPNTTEAAYSSWIADDYPFIIELEAARELSSSIGDVEAAAMYYRMLHGDPANPNDQGYYGLLNQYITQGVSP